MGGRLTVRAAAGVRVRGLPALDVRGPGETRVRLGAGVDLGRDLTLDLWPGGGILEIGRGAQFGRGVRVQLRGGGTVRLGARVQVRDTAFLKSDGALWVGDDVVIGHGTNVACTDAVTIRDRAGLGERVSVTDSDHAADGSPTWYLERPLRTAPVSIGENVLVSAGVTILRGASIGANAVVAAGAVVAGGDWPAGALLGGVPARVLKRLG